MEAPREIILEAFYSISKEQLCVWNRFLKQVWVFQYWCCNCWWGLMKCSSVDLIGPLVNHLWIDRLKQTCLTLQSLSCPLESFILGKPWISNGLNLYASVWGITRTSTWFKPSSRIPHRFLVWYKIGLIFFP